MIPSEKSVAVSRAMREAFGTADIDDVQRMTKGLSSDLVYGVVVNGSRYLLRIMTSINERNDPHRLFAAMKAAADAGIAPRVWYANVDDGIAMTDFVEEAPFPVDEARVRVPRVLRTLHALPRFPKMFNFVTIHNLFIWRFRSAGLLPTGEMDEAFLQYERIAAVYPRVDLDMVSCHNDLKPENVLFDGERVWLVDWQAAFVNDRYFDLAIVANFVVNNDAEENVFLEAYFGHAADEYQRARFFLMSQAMHMMYAAVFLWLGSGGKAVERGAPEFRAFHDRIWAGEVDLAGGESKIEYGMVHWERFLRNVRTARFEEALGIVGVGTGGRLLPAFGAA